MASGNQDINNICCKTTRFASALGSQPQPNSNKNHSQGRKLMDIQTFEMQHFGNAVIFKVPNGSETQKLIKSPSIYSYILSMVLC